MAATRPKMMAQTKRSPSATLTPGPLKIRLNVINRSGSWLSWLSSEVAIDDFLPDRARLEVRAEDRPGHVVPHRPAQVETTLRRVVEIPQVRQPYKTPPLHFGEGGIGEIGLIRKGVVRRKLEAC